MRGRIVCAIAIFVSSWHGTVAADYLVLNPSAPAEVVSRSVVSGRAAVVDGRTLWFPADGHLVRLSEIDSCNLAQWSFDPKATPVTAPALAPIPCGALAKAWLKRSIGDRVVQCEVVTDGYSVELSGQCRVGSRDLAVEMLRVGWAKLSLPTSSNRRYLEAQRLAIAARYGMWGTYVLDMPEWREKAIDKTLGRAPQADINVLRQRDKEISPPFLDARRQPSRRDR